MIRIYENILMEMLNFERFRIKLNIIDWLRNV